MCKLLKNICQGDDGTSEWCGHRGTFWAIGEVGWGVSWFFHQVQRQVQKILMTKPNKTVFNKPLLFSHIKDLESKVGQLKEVTRSQHWSAGLATRWWWDEPLLKFGSWKVRNKISACFFESWVALMNQNGWLADWFKFGGKAPTLITNCLKQKPTNFRWDVWYTESIFVI